MSSVIRRTARTGGGTSVVEYDGVLYVGGVVADDLRVGMAEQTAQVCRKLDALLETHGSDKAHVLFAQVFVTDIRAKPAMNKAWSEWIGEADLPARITIGGTFNEEGAMVEVTLTAARAGP